MARPKGSKNRARETVTKPPVAIKSPLSSAVVGSVVEKTVSEDAGQRYDSEGRKWPQESVEDKFSSRFEEQEPTVIPIRLIRQRSLRAGVRHRIHITREEMVAKSEAVGEDLTRGQSMPWELAEIKDGYLETQIGGMPVKLFRDGKFTIGTYRISGEIDSFVEALDEFVEWADEQFEAEYEKSQADHLEEIQRLIKESDAHTSPPPPEPSHVAIESEWNRIGYKGAYSFGAKVQKIAEAYNIPLGEEAYPDDPAPEPSFGSVPGKYRRFTQDELLAKVLNAMKEPV